MSNFVMQFRLKTEKFQEDIINKRFEISRKIYNSLVDVTQKRYKEMVKTKEYRNTIQELKITSEKNKKSLYLKLQELRTKFGIYEFAFFFDVKKMQHKFKSNINSHIAQSLASNLWKSYEKFLFGDGEEVRYKKFGTMQSLQGRSNKTGIIFKDGCIQWGKLKIKVLIKNTEYERECFKNKISFCRVTKKLNKFYLQIVFNGIPNHNIKYSSGRVGLDIGTQTIALSSEIDVKIIELADKVKHPEKIRTRILRAMDRSRRKNNPDNYNPDGTPKKQGSKKVIWINSKRYIKLKNKLSSISRKQAETRKYQHECLSNSIISLGCDVFVEKMNFKSLQKRGVKKDGTGKRKRFGKSLGKRAPAMLLNIIDRKLKYIGKELVKVNTFTVRASQYNHFEDTFKKKKLSQRWNDFNGIKVQRDMYSAFLISNVTDDLQSIDRNKCELGFENFLYLHNKEVERLKGNKNLSSIAI